jgi:hypothetical protein
MGRTCECGVEEEEDEDDEEGGENACGGAGVSAAARRTGTTLTIEEGLEEKGDDLGLGDAERHGQEGQEGGERAVDGRCMVSF